jgi:solute carrier family 25 S-adenosylmethionine transporter 26
MLPFVFCSYSVRIGNTVASFSRVPYEVVKQKLQTGQYTNTLVAISSMFQAQGFRAFFPMGGVAVQMLRDIPYAIFTLLAYEFMRDNWADKYHKVWKDMVAGAIAGGFGAYMTNGLDVVKTRLQTSPELYDGSVLLCTKMTFQEGGMRAFLRGSTSRLLHKIPANAMFFFFFEFFRRLLLVDAASLEGKKEDGTSTKGR